MTLTHLTVLALALALPTAATAGACDRAVLAAQTTVRLTGALDGGARGELVASCGRDGTARLLGQLTQAGDCDLAAQVARQWPTDDGVGGRLAEADQCLGEQIQGTLDDMTRLGAGTAGPQASPMEEQAEKKSPSTRRARNAEVGYLDAPATAAPMGQAGGGSGRGEDANGPRGGMPPTGSTADRSGALASTGSGSYGASPTVYGKLSFAVRFDLDSAALGADALGTLAVVARQITGLDPATRIEVVGHTDSTGSWEHNDDLSRRRAESVRRALELFGVAAGHLQVRGAGEWEPVAENWSGGGRATNRRVEFQFRRSGALVTR